MTDKFDADWKNTHPLPGCFYRRYTGQLVYVIARGQEAETLEEVVIYCNNSAKDKRYWVTYLEDWQGYSEPGGNILKWTIVE